MAEILGCDAQPAQLRSTKVPDGVSKSEIETFRCVLEGRFGPYDLVLGGSRHIRETVVHELGRLNGWDDESAESFMERFFDDLVDVMITGFVGEEHVPPLDHEDGVVFGTCHEISNRPGIVRTILVTRDRQFVEEFRGKVSHTVVLHPVAFMKLCNAARNSLRRA
ncbi:hypothetical protein [Bifidobacterium simiarum]|uniref:hypothetical protein n=1 Tax=Bifidobacterium simiarum TaxID=2045441 RepID=UPI0010546F7A|nr:hypothetical protein [Bifidobacterium simiarum]MBT1166521.1 hypothetical protein [Bifidobacterium simiarum]